MIRYEHSLSRKLAAPFYLDSEGSLFQSSSPKRTCLIPSTYPWLHECYTRKTTVSEIKAGPLLALNHPHLPESATINRCLRERILPILYTVSDLNRDQQEAWIRSEQRSCQDLAILFIMTLTLNDAWRLTLNSRAQESESSPLTDLPVPIPSVSPLDPVEIEENCVFRECCFKYGPLFLQASLTQGCGKSVWFEHVMDEGMRELVAFESGQATNCRGSLQGLISHQFWRIVGCGYAEVRSKMWNVIDSLK